MTVKTVPLTQHLQTLTKFEATNVVLMLLRGALRCVADGSLPPAIAKSTAFNERMRLFCLETLNNAYLAEVVSRGMEFGGFEAAGLTQADLAEACEEAEQVLKAFVDAAAKAHAAKQAREGTEE